MKSKLSDLIIAVLILDAIILAVSHLLIADDDKSSLAIIALVCSLINVLCLSETKWLTIILAHLIPFQLVSTFSHLTDLKISNTQVLTELAILSVCILITLSIIKLRGTVKYPDSKDYLGYKGDFTRLIVLTILLLVGNYWSEVLALIALTLIMSEVLAKSVQVLKNYKEGFDKSYYNLAIIRTNVALITMIYSSIILSNLLVSA